MLAECVFDLCQLWNGMLLGVIASIIATMIVVFYQTCRRKRDLKRKYGKTEGTYMGFKPGKPAQDWDSPKIYTSKAIIKYERDNILSIELTEYPVSDHPKFKWTGIITMDFENNGTVTWNYEIYEGESYGGGNHEFGFKKLIIKDIPDKKTYIYLIDEDIERYGKEVLEKQE